jgi:hypothetical protein
MPSELGLPFVLLMHVLTGAGILGACKLRTTRTITILLSMFAGMFVHSVVFFVCDLVKVPLTATSMFVSAIIPVLATIPLWKSARVLLGHLQAPSKHSIRLYDLPVIGLSGYIFYMILWASWYWPVTPFDAMAGIDLVAKYVVADHTIVNSVFSHPSLQGQLSNQPFYAPFAMLMQSIMKFIGFTHSQVWIGIVSVCFSVLVWAILRQMVHPFIAAVLYLIFLLTPEMFGYTYLLQTDYVNAVFMVIGVYLIWQGAEHNAASNIAASSIFFAAACWSRTETILLVGIGCLLSFVWLRRPLGGKTAATLLGSIVGLSALMFALWHVVFFDYYLPVKPSTSDQLLGLSLDRFVMVVSETWTSVISRVDYWGLVVWIFLAVTAVSALMFRKVSSLMLLLWIGSILLGLWLAGTIFSATVIEQTLRRGMFKLIPLLTFAIASSQLVTSASERLTAWEMRRSA